jgi:hypothetical protein
VDACTAAGATGAAMASGIVDAGVSAAFFLHGHDEQPESANAKRNNTKNLWDIFMLYLLLFEKF